MTRILPKICASAATAQSLQSCLTLCDPIDSSPPGSPVAGILQARTLEWVAISFSKAWKWKVKVKSLSHVRLLATPWTTAYQAPPSMGFSRQEYWSGVSLPSPPLFIVIKSNFLYSLKKLCICTNQKQTIALHIFFQWWWISVLHYHAQMNLATYCSLCASQMSAFSYSYVKPWSIVVRLSQGPFSAYSIKTWLKSRLNVNSSGIKRLSFAVNLALTFDFFRFDI